MNKLTENNIPASVLSAVFSDCTEDYLSPCNPQPGDRVTLRIRTLAGSAKRVLLEQKGSPSLLLPEKEPVTGPFEFYRADIVCGRAPVCYRFIVETEYGSLLYDKLGPRPFQDNTEADSSDGEADFSDGKSGSDSAAAEEEWSSAFRFTPGFAAPRWAQGALQYQIFTDRFCNGNPDNDVDDNEYYYGGGHSKRIRDWFALPDETDIRRFYGGDLQGIASKLDYLQSLGVEVLYLNPVFVSPSSHKYDTQDYMHVDPHLSVIARDMDHSLESWETHNGFAPKYIMRTTAGENLDASDAYFAWFCQELHSRGMRIILDGVFNHCGSFSKWMDAEGIYLNKPGYEAGAFQSTESPYRSWFRFDERTSGRAAKYEGWWGYASLPKLNYEGSEELCEEILRIAERWARPPYSIDGWRLDVAADLGHSPEFNHRFWRRFRQRLKAVNPELLIIAEHYGDPKDWLLGDQWDTVMNYDGFMDPVSFFLTGMEKHSDSRDDSLYLDGRAFFRTMSLGGLAFENSSRMSAMNQLSNHDHSRFLTRTNRQTGRMETRGGRAADMDVSLPVMRQAVMLQFTWPGAPTLYYGDEAGLTGWTDPDNRRTYPWGRENRELIEYHRQLALIRIRLPVLRSGSLKELLADTGLIAYARFDSHSRAVVAINCKPEPVELKLRTLDIGQEHSSEFRSRLLSTADGFETGESCLKLLPSEPECLRFILPPESCVLFSD